jgi:hypothetical protein
LGRNRNFGAGFFINNDIEHTEQRISLNGGVSVALLNDGNNHLTVGISAGLINWSSNYQKYKVYEREDVLLNTSTNFAELDAGGGIRYQYRNYFMRAEANAAVSQLPGNMISKYVKGINLAPHLMMGGNTLFSFDNNLYFGPLFYYRNIVLNQDTTLQKATLDFGAKMEVDRWGMWLGAGYRTNQAALTAGFGLKIINPDTLFDESRTAYFLGLSAIGSYPMNDASIFGPSIELGLTLSFGMVGEGANSTDTIQEIRGAFWRNEGNINQHKEKYLKFNSPAGLQAITDPRAKVVTLTYEWDDNQFMYLGEKPNIVQDTLLESVGVEWIGLDGIITNLASEVAWDALYPDTINTQFPDSIERLQDLISIELNGFLRVDELAADFGAQGVVYMGDIPAKFPDSLAITVNYNGNDTTVVIKKDQHISNLGLAVLKLHVMRKRLEYEFNKYFGRDMAFVWEGTQITDEVANGRQIIYIKKPTITPNNPNQKVFMMTQVKMQYTRIPDFFEKLRERRESKEGKKAAKERAKQRGGRNAYRDIVPG